MLSACQLMITIFWPKRYFETRALSMTWSWRPLERPDASGYVRITLLLGSMCDQHQDGKVAADLKMLCLWLLCRTRAIALIEFHVMNSMFTF